MAFISIIYFNNIGSLTIVPKFVNVLTSEAAGAIVSLFQPAIPLMFPENYTLPFSCPPLKSVGTPGSFHFARYS